MTGLGSPPKSFWAVKLGIAKEICEIQAKLQRERSTTEQHWQEVARYILPRQDDFFGEKRTPGEKRTEYIFDSVAPLALEKFAAAMESILTPRATKWHTLTTSSEELNADHEVRLYFDQVTDLLFKLRYRSGANYASQQHETYMSLGAFGTGVLILEDMPGKGVRYKSSHISEHYFMENLHGRIDTNYRKYRLKAAQAMEKFGDVLPEAVKKAAEKEPNKDFEFIHCVKPNPKHKPGSVNPSEYRFTSLHISVEGEKLIAEGGFRTFPFIISRYVTAPTEVYGRSPGMTALAEIKMVNAMRKSDLRARHMAIDPPILTANEQSVRRLNMKPGGINYGMLDAAGNPLVKPYLNQARIDVSNDAILQSHEIINDVFLVKLFQILVETPAMTATEVLQRAQEKGALLSPTAGRQQSEALGPMIERELDILSFSGLLPEMPEALKEAGGEFEIEYTSPLSKMQRAEEAASAQRVLEATLPLVQLDPSIIDNFDLDAYVRIQSDSNAAPARLLRDIKEVTALREQRQQNEQMQQLAAAAPGVAGAVKDIAQAQSYSQ